MDFFLIAFFLLFGAVLPAKAPVKQECYIGKNKLAISDVIPCYQNSDPRKPVPCCLKGSNCLEGGACWDARTGITYQYGCTDVTYSNEVCPAKCRFDCEKSPWVGLVYCNGTKGTPFETWLCRHPDNCALNDKCPDQSNWSATLGAKGFLPYIECKDMNPGHVALKAGSPIKNIMHIPDDDAGLSSYWSVHDTLTYPSTPPTPTASVSTTRSASQSGAQPVPSPSTSATDSASSTSSSPPAASTIAAGGKKQTVMLGVALGVGIPIGIGLIGLLSFYIVHRRRKALELDDDDDDHAYGKAAHMEPHPDSVFAHKAELPGTPVDPVEIDSNVGTVGTPSVMSSMVSPMNSEFSRLSGMAGVPSPRERWEASGDDIRPIYELAG